MAYCWFMGSMLCTRERLFVCPTPREGLLLKKLLLLTAPLLCMRREGLPLRLIMLREGPPKFERPRGAGGAP